MGVADLIISGALKKKKKEENTYNVKDGTYTAEAVKSTNKKVKDTVDTFNNVSDRIKSNTTMSFDDDTKTYKTKSTITDEEGNVTYKKPKKEEKKNIETDSKGNVSILNTKAKPETNKNIVDNAAMITKSVGLGGLGGLTGIVDSPFQSMQEGAEKAKTKSKQQNIIESLLKYEGGIASDLVNIPDFIKNTTNTLQDKDKNAFNKTVNIGMDLLNNLSTSQKLLEGAGQISQTRDKNHYNDILNARRLINDPYENASRKFNRELENYGDFTQTASELGQTIGNMIPSMAATAVTKNPNIGLVTMGYGAKGQATREAENKGADISTANDIGFAKGLTEVGTETLTGGLKFFGKGTADDLVEKGINKAIKNKAGNFIAKQAVGMAGEVGEETISDLVGTAIDKATVDPDASYSFDDWKKTALMTMLSTGALNTISGGYGRKAYQLNAEELNDIAQSKKVQDTVNERVEQFKTPDMTPEQVEQLREQTTAVVLGEIQQNVDDILDSSIQQLQEQPQIPTQTPLNTLNQGVQQENNQTPYQTSTPQITPLNQVNQELQETRQQDVADSVRAMNLEKPQEQKKNGIIESAKKYNIEQNETINSINNFLNERGLKAEFNEEYFKDENGNPIEDQNAFWRIQKDSNGKVMFDKNGKIMREVILNPYADSQKTLENITIHEMFHDMFSDSNNKSASQIYNEILNYARKNTNFDEAKVSLENLYKNQYKNEYLNNKQAFDDMINEEAVADILGNKLGDTEFIESLVKQNRNIAQRFYDAIVSFLNKLNKKAGYKSEKIFWQDIKNKYAKALQTEYSNELRNSNQKYSISKNTGKLQENGKDVTLDTSKTGYSINENIPLTKSDTGKELSKNQQQFFKDTKVRDNDGNLITVYHTMTDRGPQFNEFNPTGSDYYKFGDQVVNYYTDDKNMSGSYADQRYEMADTKKISSIEEAEKIVNQFNGDSPNETIKIEKNGNGYKLVNNLYKNAYEKAKTIWENEITDEEKKIEKDYEELYKRYVESGYDNNLVPEFTSLENYAKEYSQKLDKLNDSMTPEERNAFLSFRKSDIKVETDTIVIAEYENEDKLFRNLKQDIQKADDELQHKYQYEGYVNITNPYIIDAEGRTWNKVESKADSDFTKELLKVTKEDRQYLERLASDSIKTYNDNLFNYQQAERAINDFAVDRENTTLVQRLIHRTIHDLGFEDFMKVLNNEKEVYWGRKEQFMDDMYNNGIANFQQKKAFDNTGTIPSEVLEKVKNIINEPAKYEDRYIKKEMDALGIKPDVKNTTIFDLWNNQDKAYKKFDEGGRYENSKFDKEVNERNLYRQLGNEELFKIAKKGFTDENVRLLYNDWSVTNDIVKSIIELNKAGENYDGVIMKNVVDYGGESKEHTPHDLYITFNSNQFKAVDNLNPTEDPDIRYSKDNQTWQEYLDKNFANSGKGTRLKDINKEKQQKITKSTTETKTTPEKPKNVSKQNYLTKAEQEEYETLKELDNKGFLEETDKDYKRLQELEKKQQGIVKKFPELKKENTFDDIKGIYGKYKNNEISTENNKVLKQAKNFIEANKQGRRTKEQWLQVAEFIGNNADIKSSQDLQQLAMETWFETKPNNSNVLNRQGQKYVKFPVNEWVDAVYKGAGVGTDVKMSKEENTINENKQEDKIVLRTPTEIKPKEIKTPKQKQEYFEESGTPKKVAKILSETPRETETSSLREKYQTLKRAVVDKGEAIYRIAKQTKNRRLYAMYDRIGLATGEGNSDIGISQTNLDGESYKNFTDSKGNKTSMSLNDIWKDVENSNIPESVMNEYLAHYLNVDRYKANQLSIEEIEELKDLNKYKSLSKTQKERVEELNTLAETRNVFGKDITREDSLNKIKEIEEKYPQIKRPAENIWQYGKNQLQKMVDAGLVSKESQEYYNENTPHYVRLQRSTESKKGSVFDNRGHLQVNNQIKKAKGGTKDIIPFKDSMAQYTLDTTSSIRKNLFGQELSKTLKNGLETDGNVDIDNIDNNILNANEDGSYTFKIFKDGKPEVLTIDKGIYEALQPNKHYELEKLFTPFSAVSNFKRTVLTDKNPLFLATNFFKDFFDAPLNTKHSTLDFVKNYGLAINQILKNGEYYQKYQALGGNQNTYFDKEGFSKPSKISKIVAPIEKANEFIEMLPRMSEFITSLKKGESLDEAMYNAAEITTNFKRGGTATKIINRNGATFLNASVQGFDKQIRNFTEIENPKQAARLVTKMLVLGVAPALANAVMYDDDDEYEDLPDYVKDSYYLFKTGKDNKWVRIPKGRAISVIQAAARRTYDYSKGNKDAFKGLAGHFENQLAPNNPLESNVLSPLVDIKNNKSWNGSKIVSDSIANASHPEEEYDAKTDELSKWLGKKLGKSPKKINYFIDQNTGAIGDLLLPFLTKQAEGEDDSVAGRLLKNPVKDKFTTDAVLNSKQVNQFYDAFNKAEDDKKWSKATDKDKLKYKYLYSTMLNLAEYNKQIKEIEASDKSDKEKYRETKSIKQEMNEISRKAVKNSENVKIYDSYAQIDDKYYKKTYDKDTGEYSFTKVPDKQLDKLKNKGVSLVDYFNKAYEKQKKRATK